MRKVSVSLAVGGIMVLIAALLWHPVVEPRIVKFPDDTNVTTHYSGTMVTFQAGQQAGLAAQAPLQIDRRVQTVTDQTDAKTALVKETVTARFAGTVQQQSNAYALDRRSMANVADPDAYALTPANVVDRSGSYYVNLPMGVTGSGSQFKIFENKIGRPYDLMTVARNATGKLDGLSVVRLSGGYSFTPVTAAERSALASTGLPLQLTSDQIAAQLKAAGINVDQAVTGLAQVLTPAELATVTTALAAPVPLQYFGYGSGQATVGNKTGMIVALNDVVDGIAAKPDLSGLQPVLAVLTQHAGIPAIDSVITTLKGLAAAAPQRVYELRYSQTPASVTAMVNEAKSRTQQMDLATTTAPRVLFGLAVILLIAAVVTFAAGKKRDTAATEPVPIEPVVPEPAATKTAA